jgi:hypothetical protein
VSLALSVVPSFGSVVVGVVVDSEVEGGRAEVVAGGAEVEGGGTEVVDEAGVGVGVGVGVGAEVEGTGVVSGVVEGAVEGLGVVSEDICSLVWVDFLLVFLLKKSGS